LRRRPATTLRISPRGRGCSFLAFTKSPGKGQQLRRGASRSEVAMR
jgi:hypothetical protein